MYTEISCCRICGNRRLEPVLDLGSQALTGIFPRTRDEVVPSGPLQLVKCHGEAFRADQVCGLVQLRHSYSPDEIYGGRYGYRSSLNRSMVQHLQRRVERIQRYLRLSAGDLVLDVGSNDGTLLKAYAQTGLTRVGIDPTGYRFASHYPPDVDMIAEIFSADAIRSRYGERKARVITSIAMFYDLEAPLEFVRQIAGLLAGDGIWVFEQSYLPMMVQENAYDAVCHEHLEFYGLRQIKWILDRVDLKITDIEFNDVNGGSICVTASRRDSPYPPATELIDSTLAKEAHDGLDRLEYYHEFRGRVLQHGCDLKALIHSLKQKGKLILGYGASTKGNVTLQHCELTEREVPAIAEVNEDKYGAFTPGTLIPIVSEDEARRMNPDYFLVLPWHFRESILRREQEFLRRGGGMIFPLPRIEVLTL